MTEGMIARGLAKSGVVWQMAWRGGGGGYGRRGRESAEDGGREERKMRYGKFERILLALIILGLVAWLGTRSWENVERARESRVTQAATVAMVAESKRMWAKSEKERQAIQAEIERDMAEGDRILEEIYQGRPDLRP